MTMMKQYLRRAKKNEFVRTTSMEEDSEDDTSTGTESNEEIEYALTTQAVSRANTVGAFSYKKKLLNKTNKTK